MMPSEGRARVIVENVQPSVDCGTFPAKRVVGEPVVVSADIFADGHDVLGAVMMYRGPGEAAWTEVPMTPLVNDRWEAVFTVTRLGAWSFTVEGWVDRLRTWRRDLGKRLAAGQDVATDLLIGAALVREAAARAGGADGERLARWAEHLEDTNLSAPERVAAARDEALLELAERHPDRSLAVRGDQELVVRVDPEVALFSAWYELFPRSTAAEPGRHGTFRDVERRLPRIAAMGFDVLYLPPIHPIGKVNRKGRNNAVSAQPGEPGSPWAIGSDEGGHTAIHPELGTLDDFRHLVGAAKEHGLQVALDIALQCAPDHPYVREHPGWFRHRPDGTIQYAENPPKKYQDIVPFDFECDDWRGLWEELHRVFRFWMEQGVRIFRVDNPHTKSFPFWQWLIGRVHDDAPDVVFLAEAFTRPKVLYRLAKLGFNQSYNYFPWRNTPRELTAYFEELYRPPVVDFLRPNLWPNTPDILTEFLQTGGRPAFAMRFLLAATLGSTYGIYGPAFELLEATPRERGSEEYLDSEKYEIRHWDLDRPHSLEPLIARVNRIRRENPALHRNRSLRFHPADNEQLLCFSKHDAASGNTIIVAANLDPYHRHAGWITFDPEDYGLEPSRSFQVHDLLGGSRYLWRGTRHYVEIDPHVSPAHIFRLRRHLRTEHDFEYFL